MAALKHFIHAHHSSQRVAVLLFVLAAAALVAGFDALHDELVGTLEAGASVITEHSSLGAVLFVVLSALSAMLMFFSSVVLVPVGIEAWGETRCFLLLWGGWFLGGVLTYSIGRHLGRPTVERMLSRATVERYRHSVPHGASFLTALLIQAALPSDVVGYFFGLLRFPRPAYLAALLIAELPYAFGTVFLGAAFLEGRYLQLLGAALIAIAILVWQRRARARHPPR